MYKQTYLQRKALRFRQFKRKGYALFACLGRVVTIGVLSVATLTSASAAIKTFSVVGDSIANTPGDDSPDKEATLDDVEITGSRAPLALGQAARMVTVLSREDIQAAPVQSINDLLKLAVGVDVRQRGPVGAQTDVSIRGGTSEQITILLNGINICDPQTGHNTFDFPCDLSDIERIEILEGPAGRVYGTSSLVGAINIVTTSSPKLGEVRRGLNMRMEGGSFGYLSAAGRMAIDVHSLSANYTRSDGYSRSKAGHLNSDYNGFKTFYQGSTTLNSKLSTLNFQLSYCHLHQQKQEAAYLQSQYSLEYLRHKVTASLRWTISDHLRLSLNYRWQDRMGSYTTVDGKVCDYHPYSVVDARLDWLQDSYTLYLEGNNLTGHRYVDYGNVPQPGCWITAGYAKKF